MEGIRVEPSPQLSLEGRSLKSETLLTAAGAHVLVLSTSIGELGATLHSTYVGHVGTDTLVTHLMLGEEARSFSRTHEHHDMPVAYARRLCLYDHLHELRVALADEGHPGLQVDVLEEALALVDS